MQLKRPVPRLEPIIQEAFIESWLDEQSVPSAPGRGLQEGVLHKVHPGSQLKPSDPASKFSSNISGLQTAGKVCC